MDNNNPPLPKREKWGYVLKEAFRREDSVLGRLVRFPPTTLTKVIMLADTRHSGNHR